MDNEEIIYVRKDLTADQLIEHLVAEVIRQWERNHYEMCMDSYPHVLGGDRCVYPLPFVLQETLHNLDKVGYDSYGKLLNLLRNIPPGRDRIFSIFEVNLVDLY